MIRQAFRRAALTLACVLPALIAGCRDATGATYQVRERWYATQPGYGYPRPAVTGDRVFFGTGDGQVIARSQSTGDVLWAAQVANETIYGGSMIVRKGVVVVPIVNSTVALDVMTGQQIWRYDAPLDTIGNSSTTSLPGSVARTHLDADSTTVYIPAWGASVSAVDVGTGAVRWTWRPARAVSDTAASGMFRSGSQGIIVSGDTLFATVWHYRDTAGIASEAWLVALDRLSGAELWRVTLPSYTSGAMVWGRPVVDGNLVIFESVGGHEYAIDRATRQVAWEYKPNTLGATFAQTEIRDGVVYHDGGDHRIYALRARDGGLVWQSASFGSQTSRDMLVTDRHLFFTDGNALFVLDRQSGRQLAELRQPHSANSFFGSPAAYANGQVFVTVNGGAWSFDEP